MSADDWSDVGACARGPPLAFRVGASGFGLGVGCGVGVGFGTPLSLRACSPPRAVRLRVADPRRHVGPRRRRACAWQRHSGRQQRPVAAPRHVWRGGARAEAPAAVRACAAARRHRRRRLRRWSRLWIRRRPLRAPQRACQLEAKSASARWRTARQAAAGSCVARQARGGFAAVAIRSIAGSTCAAKSAPLSSAAARRGGCGSGASCQSFFIIAVSHVAD